MNHFSDDNYQHTQIKSGAIGYWKVSGRASECSMCKLGDMYAIKDKEGWQKCSECGVEVLIKSDNPVTPPTIK